MKKNYHLHAGFFALCCSSLLSSGLFAQAGSIDLTFNPGTGADDVVYTTAIQSDQSILIGGNFTTYNGAPRKSIARILVTGTLDNLFDVGVGANNRVEKILESNGKILVGGWFTSYNTIGRNRMMSLNDDASVNTNFAMGNAVNPYVRCMVKETDFTTIIGGNFSALTTGGPSRKCIARIDVNGALDPTFNPGTGANSAIAHMAFQNTGKLIIAGSFTTYNGIARNGIARINTDGSLDMGFDPGAGADQSITGMAIQDDGKILIGGFFSNYNGVPRKGVARLLLNGTLDASFNPGTGTNSYVTALVQQPDGRVIIAGDFTAYNGTPRAKIARLHFDGTLDTSFDPGSGPSGGSITTMEIQFNGRIILGGFFTSYDGTTRNHIARIYGDAQLGVDTPSLAADTFSVYPNPAKDFITINCSTWSAPQAYTVFNLSGQRVLNGMLTGANTKVDVSALPLGVYLVEAGGMRLKMVRE